MESGNRDQGRPKNAAGKKIHFLVLFKTESLDC